MHPRLPRLRHLLLAATAPVLAAAALLALGVARVAAGPEGGTVVGGAATIQGQGSASVIVNQSTPSAIINWNTFNIGASERVQFNQPSTSAVALNRVVGGRGPSEILGTLTANGRIFLINRDGILFGPGSVVNTAGFLASTNDIRNADFMAGRYNFNIPGRPDASIVNQGRITATSGGFAALVAPGVRNSGTITATLGTVALAAGNSFTLDMYGDKLITLAVNDEIAANVIDVATGKPLKSLVTNDGKIRANGGRVELTAAAARRVVDSVINTSGVITANSIGHRNGKIVLAAATGASKPAGAPAQTIKISGRLSAAGKRPGTKGGTILVSGEHIKVAAARVDASGRAGGGKVLIGGDWGGGRPDKSLVNNQAAKLESFAVATATTVSVDGATTINASATERGHGGKVILWSDAQTTFAGTILARGGAQAGDGGFVETSSKGQLAFTGNVDTRAPHGAAGTLLLDPADYYIVPDGQSWTPPDASRITRQDLENQLLNGNVVIATNNSISPMYQSGDIFVQTSINWSNNNSLTLSAYRDINIYNFDNDVTIANTANGNLLLRADSTGNGMGTVNFSPSPTASFSGYVSMSSGTTSIYFNPSINSNLTGVNPNSYVNPTENYAPQITGSYRAYMLVNNVTDLQNIQNNLSATSNASSTVFGYAIGNNIDATAFTGFAPGATFNTVLDGSGGLGANYTISDLTTTLFPVIGTTGMVRNLNLASVNIAAAGGPIHVGALAGENRGKVSDVHVLGGSVSGSQMSVGGLIGQNTGTIEDASSAVNVSVGDGAALSAVNVAGGLVGTNLGTISGSSASGNVSGGAFSVAGGLVGQNQGAIESSSASGNVSVGAFSWAGGLVGSNGMPLSGNASIVSSFATGAVSSTGINVGLGGLAGFNAPGALISASYATGDVTASAGIATQNGASCAATNSCQFLSAGGLVGQNFGEIELSYAQGNVGVGGNGTGGGLAGFNSGVIVGSWASGDVTGAAGTGGVNGEGGSTTLGGLAGFNHGLIVLSYAEGNVGSPGTANLEAGGLVGGNSGTILSSAAFGNVQAGDGSMAGGLVASNSPTNFNCPNCLIGDGAPFFNSAFIFDSHALGDVMVGAASLAGGLAGTSDGGGIITSSSATGAVTGGGNSVLGGFIGALGFEGGPGGITNSTASGPVTSTGPNSIVGGFAGLASGTILDSSATGPVTGTSDSYLGGFVGVNLGLVYASTAASSVTGTGNRDVVGGFVGANFGSIDSSSSSGNASGGTNSAVGGFAGANARFVNFSAGSIPGSSFPVGTITNSSASGSASGGQGSTVGPFIARDNPTTASNPPAFPSIVGGCNEPTCVFVNTGVLPSPSPLSPFSPEFLEQLAAQQTQQILNLTNTIQLAALNTAPVVNTIQGGIRLPPQQAPPPTAGRQFLPPGIDQRIIDIPPPGETRFVQDEVMVQIRADLGLDQLRAAIARLGLTILASEDLSILGSIAVRLHIDNGRSPAEVIRALAAVQLVAVAQPQYLYTLDQQASEPAPASRGTQQGDEAQYILQKLSIADVHRLVRGTNVPIAVIDSQVDVTHPDLEGVVAQRYSAVGAEEKPHAHGTGMAGAIAAHQRLLGTAPAARLLAVHAFSTGGASPESTTFNILKGINWSVSQGVRIINMSFAGPKDPSLERALRVAYGKGIVLIAAAGNAGPKSPPLYPGADPNVIAVTATDVEDKLFAGANRGKYVSVAAPGVDILVPAPENGYQLTTGTSVAAAEVSGIVALLLERNPKLTPADVRRILTQSARRLSPGERDDNFGSGLIDPLKALQLADPRSASTVPPSLAPPMRIIRQR